MFIYLADLCHNYVKGLNSVPLNIGYLASYIGRKFGDEAEFKLFKNTEELLDNIDNNPPHILGLSNYTWNQSLNKFIGQYVKANHPDTVIAMGGPNIRLDNEGIYSFLKKNDFVDLYIMLEGEIALSNIVEKSMELISNNINIKELKNILLSGCFSINENNNLIGKMGEEISDLDIIPSPYLTGILDKFLTPEFIPLLETNRGCPYSCTYCAWGVSSRKKLRQFSLDRVINEIDYIADKGAYVPYWTFADANFGILKRDVIIAEKIREVYDNKSPFSSVEIWWDKSAQNHMIDISRILGHLSNAYIAFQSFDPKVLDLISRKNIDLNKLKSISKELAIHSDRLHTDILVGLPGETYESHLNSLKTALELGFESIGGGEIRLLAGSELETGESRKIFGLKTKYRLTQEGYGLYRNKFIFELEESVRQTNHISEAEMLKLRSLRAIFYISITLGQFLPLVRYLIYKKIDVLEFFGKLIEKKDNFIEKIEPLDWLVEKAKNEWFNTEEAAEDFLKDKANQNKVLNQSSIKLNYDFLSYLLQTPQRYNIYTKYLNEILLQEYPQCDKEIISEILALCKSRNFLLKCIEGNYEKIDKINFSKETISVLLDLKLIKTDNLNGNSLIMEIDDKIGEAIKESICGDNTTIQLLSWILQSYNIFMNFKHSL